MDAVDIYLPHPGSGRPMSPPCYPRRGRGRCGSKGSDPGPGPSVPARNRGRSGRNKPWAPRVPGKTSRPLLREPGVISRNSMDLYLDARGPWTRTTTPGPSGRDEEGPGGHTHGQHPKEGALTMMLMERPSWTTSLTHRPAQTCWTIPVRCTSWQMIASPKVISSGRFAAPDFRTGWTQWLTQ